MSQNRQRVLRVFLMWGAFALVQVVSAQSPKEGKAISDWIPVLEAELDGVPGKAYWSPSSIKRNDDIIKAWLKFEFPDGVDMQGSLAGTVTKDITKVLEFMVLDCQKGTAVGDTEIIYRKNGKIYVNEHLGNRNQASTDQTPFGKIVADYFCERDVIRPSNGPPVLRKRDAAFKSH